MIARALLLIGLMGFAGCATVPRAAPLPMLSMTSSPSQSKRVRANLYREHVRTVIELGPELAGSPLDGRLRFGIGGLGESVTSKNVALLNADLANQVAVNPVTDAYYAEISIELEAIDRVIDIDTWLEEDDVNGDYVTIALTENERSTGDLFRINLPEGNWSSQSTGHRAMLWEKEESNTEHTSMSISVMTLTDSTPTRSRQIDVLVEFEWDSPESKS